MFAVIRKGWTERVVERFETRKAATKAAAEWQKHADEDFQEGRAFYDLPEYVVREELESGLKVGQ